jgi:hypothetical protein
MIGLIVLGLTLAAAVFSFQATRRFVRERLRYVDVAKRGAAPWLAAAGTALVALPVVALLPGFGAGSALLVAASVGFGVARGARDIRSQERLLAPWS